MERNSSRLANKTIPSQCIHATLFYVRLPFFFCFSARCITNVGNSDYDCLPFEIALSVSETQLVLLPPLQSVLIFHFFYSY